MADPCPSSVTTVANIISTTTTTDTTTATTTTTSNNTTNNTTTTISNDHPSSTNCSNDPIIYGEIRLTLENCILPADRLQNTPSVADGLTVQEEYELRLLGCELIQTGGILLRLPQVAMATAQVLFHRFYYSKSLVRHQYETLAMACVALASKIEEEPRRVREVMNVFHHINQIRSGISPSPILIDNKYAILKDHVIMAERRLLKELGFCVHVKHPHKFIVALLQALEKEKDRRLIQIAWNYMNDSLRTDLFVRYSPETIACSCVFLSARLLKVALPDDPPWFEVFGASIEEIEDVCHRILKLYSCGKPDQERLRTRLTELKREYEQKQLPLRSVRVNGSYKQSTSKDTKNLIPCKETTNTDQNRKNEIISSSTHTIDDTIKSSAGQLPSQSLNIEKRHERHSSRSPDRRREVTRRRHRSPDSADSNERSKSDERTNDDRNRSRYESSKEDYGDERSRNRSDERDRKRRRDRYRELDNGEKLKSHRSRHHGESSGRNRVDDYTSRYSHRNDDAADDSYRRHRDYDRHHHHQRRRRSTSRERYGNK